MTRTVTVAVVLVARLLRDRHSGRRGGDDASPLCDSVRQRSRLTRRPWVAPQGGSTSCASMAQTGRTADERHKRGEQGWTESNKKSRDAVLNCADAFHPREVDSNMLASLEDFSLLGEL